MDDDQFICIQGESPEGLQGFRDEIWACEKFLANADGGCQGGLYGLLGGVNDILILILFRDRQCIVFILLFYSELINSAVEIYRMALPMGTYIGNTPFLLQVLS